jgi:hypothetical protein
MFQVTADGSIDCQEDPGEQESLVASLHYCETVSALHILAQGEFCSSSCHDFTTGAVCSDVFMSHTAGTTKCLVKSIVAECHSVNHDVWFFLSIQ